jgi:DNA-binding protein H-NS
MERVAPVKRLLRSAWFDSRGIHHHPSTITQKNEMSIALMINKREQLAADLAAQDAMIAEVRKAERQEALDKIKAIMEEHGITADQVAAKPVATAGKPRRKKAEPKAGAVTYNINGTIYVQGQRGRVPFVVAAAREAGTLEQYRVAA